jgi:hypothetical protein
MKQCPFCAEQIQRAAVVCRHCGRTVQSPATNVWAEVAAGFGAFCFVGALLYAGMGVTPFDGKMASAFVAPAAASRSTPAAAPKPPPPPPPLVVTVLDEAALDLPPGEHFDTAFAVSDPRPCTFRARVQGVEGGNRDVEVYLLDEDGNSNWHNGIKPAALYESGRTSASTIEVPLHQKGRFHLLVSNRYSLMTPKTVQVENARVVCK